MKHFILGALIAGALGAVSFVSPASAQATRTWVSGVGDDANPCSRTAPCKTFAGAYSKTAASGEINCLDSAGYGAVTVSKSLTLKCQGVVGSILVSGTNALVINTAATDHVVVDGLEFEGLNGSPTPGLNGIQVIGSGAIFIQNCSIRHFSQNGVNVVGTAGARVMIDNCTIINNNGGVNVQGAAGASNSAAVTHSFVDGNTSFGVQANGAVNSVAIAWDVISNNGTNINSLGGAPIASFGPSSLVPGASAPTSTTPFK
ncbi:MAG: hypothetical protein QOF41_463 [Methylobacteriaceae bacterium]|jgi:hypothetical protein|nr:hypothetical protein [Methylobacteriaceae bacterium]